MGSNRTGARSQLTGERAEAKVRDVLLDASLFCSKYEHDRGEDLLVELEGYDEQSDDGAGPRIGLLQIKGHEVDIGEASDNFEVRRRLAVCDLRRWAAIPLPVFVVAVEISRNVPLFFAHSVDKLVGEVAPEGLAALEQRSITVSLPRVADVAGFLRTEIADFYSLHAFELSRLSEDVIARNHYEIISRSTPFVPPQAKAWIKNVRVLWKGPWRPAHFWATVNHLADTLRENEGRRRVPLMATMHLYRSLKDCRDNNAVAHVSWLEDDHAETEQLRELIKWPKAAHWARFRFNGRLVLDALPNLSSQEEDDDAFVAKAEAIWSCLDTIYFEFVSCLTSDLRLPESKRIELEEAMSRTQKELIDELGHAATQFRVLDLMIDQYSSALSEAFDCLKCKEDVPELRRQRWLRQDLEFAVGHYRAYHPLVKLLYSR